MQKQNAYQAIARKFRPHTFSEVVEQEAIVTTLKNALEMDKLAYAYLFCGSRGTGKTTLARLLAKAVNCQNLSSEKEPCNECSSCLEISSLCSLDVLEMDGASNRGIEDIRQITETVQYAPSTGKYKIYIIDEVHMLTKEAFNALLKTLEEPPSHVKFLFATTEPHKIPATILSRCQRFDLSRISSLGIVQRLKKIALLLNMEYEEGALELIAEASEGSLRDASSLLDQFSCYAQKKKITQEMLHSLLDIVPLSAFFELDQAVQKGNLSFAFELTDRIFNSGKDFLHFLDQLIGHFRYILLIKINHLSSPSDTEKQKKYIQQASLYTEEHCLYILDLLTKWIQEASKTPYKRNALEIILLQIIRSKNRISSDTLVKRLIELEKTCSAKETSSEERSTTSLENIPLLSQDLPVSPLESKHLFKEEENVQKPSIQERLEAKLVDEKEKILNPSLPQKPSSDLPTVDPEQEKKEMQKDPALHSRYQTILRFAAVELEGSCEKEFRKRS